MTYRLWLAVAVVGTAGCAKKRDPAPTEMEDLVRYLFLHWEEDELVPEGLDNLHGWLADNIDTEAAEDGFRLSPLTEADVAAVDHPDVDPALLIGASGAAVSPYPIGRQAEHIVLEDQVFSNPGTYDVYDRTVTGDEEAFLDGTGLVRTSNAVVTSTLGVTIPYTLLKDYRWVDGELSDGILARSWIAESSCNEGGGNCLVQSYSIDVFFAVGEDATWRFTASWSQITSGFELGEDLMVASLAGGIQNIFRFTDAYLAGE